MENLFANIPADGEVADNASAVDNTATPVMADSKGKKEKAAAMMDCLRQTMTADPTFADRLRTLSDSIEVVNTLGFGDKGNLVVDKSASTMDDRKLASTSAIIGYSVRNIGTEPIKYMTEEYAKGEDGKWVGKTTEKILEPGGTAYLSRQYMTMLCAQPEISFQLSNGKIIKGSGGKGTAKDIKAELESYYFAFNRDASGYKKQVNDDEVKLNVGVREGDTWVVKPEFELTFGYLNNPKEVRTRSKGTKGGLSFNTQDVAANYVFQMIKGSNL